MLGQENAAGIAQRQTEINSAKTNVNKNLAELRESLDMFLQRLSPVLSPTARPEHLLGSIAVQKEQHFGTELGCDINGFAKEISEFSAKIQDAQKRLEL